MSHPERGTIKPLWLTLGVIVCVTVGAVVNQCILCGPADDGAAAVPPSTVQGRAFLEPDPEPPTYGEQAEKPDEPKVKLTPLKPPEDPRPPEPKDDHLALTFEKLGGYEYVLPDIGEDTKPTNQIPESIKKLSGERVAIRGFMVPIKIEGEEVLEFVLVVNQMVCCFGQIPKMNEWIHVVMEPGKTAPYAVDIPVTVYGKLDVGELWENGIIMSLYRIAGTEVTEPPIQR